MEWFCFYLLPAAVAWKRRSENPGSEIFILFGTMLSAFLAIWCEGLVSNSISTLLPGGNPCRPWIRCGSVIIIWIVTTVAFNKVLEQVVPQGVDSFIFPAKLSKPLAFAASFFNAGLILSLVFTALAVSPAAPYVSFITESPALSSSARFRILCNTFFIDRFSLQSVSINQRRRAFDRFIPEVTGNGTAQDPSQTSKSRKAK